MTVAEPRSSLQPAPTERPAFSVPEAERLVDGTSAKEHGGCSAAIRCTNGGLDPGSPADDRNPDRGDRSRRLGIAPRSDRHAREAGALSLAQRDRTYGDGLPRSTVGWERRCVVVREATPPGPEPLRVLVVRVVKRLPLDLGHVDLGPRAPVGS